jgi:hypothetical protein
MNTVHITAGNLNIDTFNFNSTMGSETSPRHHLHIEGAVCVNTDPLYSLGPENGGNTCLRIVGNTSHVYMRQGSMSRININSTPVAISIEFISYFIVIIFINS